MRSRASSLNADISPGRLFFNDSLIEVRSSEEERLIALLKDASISLLDLEDLRRLARNLPMDSAALEALAVADDDHLLERTRDEIVAFVLSDEYVDIARNGLPVSKGG